MSTLSQLQVVCQSIFLEVYVLPFSQQFMSPRCPGGPRAPLRMPSQVQPVIPSALSI